MFKNKKGFTIVELIIVIVIIAVLAAVLIPLFTAVVKKSQDAALLTERTNQKIDDAVQKIDNANWLSWEDFEAKLAERLAENDQANQEKLTAAVKEAVREYLGNNQSENTGVTPEQVEKIIEKALEGSLTTAQVEAIVNAAIKNIPAASSLSEAQVKAIVDAAISKIPTETGVTKEQMEKAISEALAVALTDSVSPEDIQTAIEKALESFTVETLTEEQIKAIISQAIAEAQESLNEDVPTGMAGKGTESDPYQITKEDDFNSANGCGHIIGKRYYKLMNDVEITKADNQWKIDDGSEVVFDMNGHKLKIGKSTYKPNNNTLANYSIYINGKLEIVGNGQMELICHNTDNANIFASRLTFSGTVPSYHKNYYPYLSIDGNISITGSGANNVIWSLCGNTYLRGLTIVQNGAYEAVCIDAYDSVSQTYLPSETVIAEFNNCNISGPKAICVKGATATINGGRYISTDNEDDCWCSLEDGSLKINNGTFVGYFISWGGTLTVKDGIFDGCFAGIAYMSDAILTINGGTYALPESELFYTWNDYNNYTVIIKHLGNVKTPISW